MGHRARRLQPYGTAWDSFSHDQARSRAYRWGEDGLAGISDKHQFICFALALWNGRDPILKERLFGLTGSEGNHGEDVKEYYFYLDSTPTHSYMKYLYKYPQSEFPYAQLVEENRRRGKRDLEFELIHTGIFDEDRYFDVFVEYAKGSPDDVLIRIEAINRGPEAAELHLLPTVWFRNTWSWNAEPQRPWLRRGEPVEGIIPIELHHSILRQTMALLRREPGDAFHRERDQQSPSLRRGQRFILRQGWNQRLHRAWRERGGECRRRGNESGRPLSAQDRAGKERRRKAPAHGQRNGLRREPAFRRELRSHCSPSGEKKPMSSMPASPRRVFRRIHEA